MELRVYKPTELRITRKPVYSIIVRLGSKTLELYKDGMLFKTYPVAIGKPSTPTPIGDFTIINKAVNPGGAFGAKWLGLSIPHYGIHGTNEPTSIGTPASHGCVRMQNPDVEELYSLVDVGTRVQIVP